MRFELIQDLNELDETDVKHLSKARDTGLYKIDPEALADSLVRGRAQLWRLRFDDGGAGVLVTQVSGPRGQQELLVWLMSGRGILKHGEEVFEQLAKFGKQIGCKWVTGIAKPGLARVYERKFGFEKKNIQVVKEIE